MTFNFASTAGLRPGEQARRTPVDLSKADAVHRVRDASMNSYISIVLACLSAGTIASAIGPNSTRRLTPQRIAELTAPSAKAQTRSISIEIADLQNPAPRSGQARPRAKTSNSRIILPMDGREGVIEVIREFRFPTQFDPPKVSLAEEKALIAPLRPRAFETVNTGWTIRLNARPVGNLTALYGVADYIEFRGFDEAGYGPLSGPIHDQKDRLLSPNVLQQPVFETTTTRFHIFAVPGETYEVVLHHGRKSTKHRITVTAE
jgi:hypothetical protein